jgi:hypothetical protein
MISGGNRKPVKAELWIRGIRREGGRLIEAPSPLTTTLRQCNSAASRQYNSAGTTAPAHPKAAAAAFARLSIPRVFLGSLGQHLPHLELTDERKDRPLREVRQRNPIGTHHQSFPSRPSALIEPGYLEIHIAIDPTRP